MKVIDLENELRILASALSDKECLWKLLNQTSEDDFFGLDHKTIYKAILQSYSAQGVATVDGVAFTLKKGPLNENKALELVKSLYVLSDIYNFDFMLEDLLEQSRVRKIQSSLKRDFQSIDTLSDAKRKKFLEDYRASVLREVFYEKEQGGCDVEELCSKNLLLEEAQKNHGLFLKGEKIFRGYPTNFRDLDLMIHGLNPGHLVVIGARPGCGKSTLMLNLASNMNVKNMIFSLEMTESELFKKMLLKECNIDYNSFSTGNISKQNFEDIERVSKDFSKKNIRIDGRSGVKPSELYRRAHQRKISSGLDVIYVDYLQLMNSDEKTENNQARVTSISRALKKIAKDLNVTVVALAQLNREVENRENKIPRNSDLRESGSIEADADVILLLSNDKEACPYVLDVHVSKNRFGSVGKISLFWNLSTGKMGNLQY